MSWCGCTSASLHSGNLGDGEACQLFAHPGTEPCSPLHIVPFTVIDPVIFFKEEMQESFLENAALLVPSFFPPSSRKSCCCPPLCFVQQPSPTLNNTKHSCCCKRPDLDCRWQSKIYQLLLYPLHYSVGSKKAKYVQK